MAQGVFFCVYSVAVYKNIAEEVQRDHIITIASAVGSVCNGFPRLIWAAALDKFGFRKVYAVILVIELISSCAMWYCRTNSTLYIICVGMAFCCLGGHFSTFPAASARIFGI